jgi:hypothetical protein
LKAAAMHPILFLAAATLIFLINGLPIVLITAPETTYRDILPAPVIGAALLSILVTVLFSWNVAPDVTTLVSTALAGALILILILRRGLAAAGGFAWHRNMTIRVAALLIVALLLVLPHMIGGQQFALFQANRYDSLNYLSAALGYATRSYSQLRAFDAHAEPVASYAMAKQMLVQRPTVALLYASIYRIFSSDVFGNAYDFCLAAELALYCGFLYLLLLLFPKREKAAHILSVALIVGFFGQYLLDINAWSALFAIPIMIVMVTDFCIGLQPDETDTGSGARNLFLFLRMPILAAGMTYMYPEITPIAAMACGGAVLAALFIRRAEARAVHFALLRHNIVFAIVTLAIVGLYWTPTIGFLLQQAKLATSDVVDWQLFFQAYLLGGPDAVVPATGSAHLAEVLLIIPANFLAGFFGLYFIQPGSKLDTAHLVWSAGLILAFSILVWAIMSAARRELNRRSADQKPQLFAIVLSAIILTSLVPLALLLRGQSWAAGKGLSMISPFLFLLIVLPLLAGRRKPQVSALVWMLVAGHLMFGLFRPLAIAAHSDRHNYAYPYPSAPKENVNWDVDSYRKALQNCRLVRIDVDDPFLDRVVEDYLVERNIAWYSLHRRNGYYGLGEDLGLKSAPQGQSGDCTISSQPGSSSKEMTWVQMTR